MEFERKESAYYNLGADDSSVVEVIATRYIGANPPLPFNQRAFSTAGIMQNGNGLYKLDFTETYAYASNGSYVYAYCLVWSDEERSINTEMMPLGPVTLYHNNISLYTSTVVEELKPDGKAIVPLLLSKGWNTLLIEARKTAAGFGCYFGAEEAKVRILQVLSPFAERSGQAGWIYSEPCAASIYNTEHFPDWRAAEGTSPLSWYPRVSWTIEEKSMKNVERVFGISSDAAAYARTRIQLPADTEQITLQLATYGAIQIWLEEQLVFESQQAGAYSKQISVNNASRLQQVKVWCASGPEHWGFELDFLINQQQLSLQAPLSIHGYEGSWIFAGPLSSAPPDSDNKPFNAYDLITAEGKQLYWQLDAPSFAVRPYYENAMLSNKWTVGTMSNFARWDYPLGVTMYGLLRTAKQLNRQDITQYALSHITSCTDWYAYSRWDYEQYGFPGINHQLVLMKMLDNCGSFGSAMLEAYSLTQDENAAAIAHSIADFMINTLESKADGAFYRTGEGEYFADTIWADDLYMSTPFLIRYALLFNQQHALDLAAKQFILYRSYLFIEDHALMSHVYDFKYNKATEVPWGRGNGWVLFSLSELLEQLPASHPDREQLLTFYRQFVEGIAKQQHDSGLWHQVVNEPESYLEASCTAMFLYGIARGIRFGWLTEQEHYVSIVEKGWIGLASYAIDRQGHVYRVCSGSRYSFSPDYYMYDLRTVINDNHGIGIMMLAGVEVQLMRKFLNQ